MHVSLSVVEKQHVLYEFQDPVFHLYGDVFTVMKFQLLPSLRPYFWIVSMISKIMIYMLQSMCL
jgi:hypothetical protein